MDIIERALTAPIKQIAENGGLDGSVVCVKVRVRRRLVRLQRGQPLLRRSRQSRRDRAHQGGTGGLQNAASISGLLLTTDCAIVEVKEKAKAGAGPRTWITKSHHDLLILPAPASTAALF